MEEKPTIIISQIAEKDKLKKMVIKKQVKKSGDGGHVMLPRELIGKYVQIIYEDETWKN